MGLMKLLSDLPGKLGGLLGRSNGISFKISVDRASQAKIRKALKILPIKVFNKVVKSASRFAITPVLSEARSRAKGANRLRTKAGRLEAKYVKARRSGTLAKSLGKKVKAYKNSWICTAWVGARPGFRDPQTGEDPQNIAHMVEYGTKPHYVGKGSRTRGKKSKNLSGKRHPGAEPYPFLRPALDMRKDKVLSRYRDRLIKGIERETEKLGGAKK